MMVATLLLGVLLAQGHGATTQGAGGTRSTARSGEVQRRAPPTATARATTTGGDSNAGGDKSSGGQKGDGDGDGAGGKGTAAASEGGSGGGAPGKNFKSKTYNFGAMDVEGKLKTPQLLYFLNRVKLELDMSAPDSRSFMKELERSADDKNL
jgi:hypothetical protein